MKRKILYLIKMVSKNLLYGFMLQCAFLTTLLASNSEAQIKSIDKTFLRLQKKEWTIKEIFRDLESRTDYTFIFPDDLLADRPVIGLNSGRQSVNDILVQVAQNAQLGFKQVNNSIYVGERPITASNERIQITIEQVPVSGTVTDQEGMAIPGVTVIVEGTNIGTTTDIDGKYSFEVPEEKSVLIFSFIGYSSQRVTVGSRNLVDITLQEDMSSLDEVVVVGYGTQRKSDLTGALSSIKSEDLTRLSERRLDNLLQGRAAGVQVMRTEGAPGAASSIHIRGAGSIGNTEPLWIIDGVPMNPGNHFNPADIQSMEILKDAAAAAIYGARAAHGVILVTTKNGGYGEKVQVNYTNQIGVRRPRPLPNMLGTSGFIDANNRARLAAGQSPELAWANPGMLANTNWVDEVFAGSGFEQSHNLSVSGGNETAKFFTSIGYDSEDGVMINNKFERFAARANSEFKVGKRIRVGQNLLVSRTVENPTNDPGGDLLTIFRAIPIMPVRDPDNPLGGWGRAPSYFQGPNPVAAQMQNHIKNTTNRINGNMYAEVDVMKDLKVRGSLGVNYSGREGEAFREGFSYGSLSNPIASLTYQSNNSTEINTNLVATYQKTVEKHDFSIMAGYERFQQDGTGFSAIAQNFPVNFSRSFALATGAVNIEQRNSITDQYRLESIFGRINYSFNNRYLLSVNLRRDGSSRFGPANQHGVFPSFSIGWRIIEESFMNNISWLSDLKIRASYGVLGSDRIGDYIFSPTYQNNASTYAFDPTGVFGGTKVRGFYLRRFPNTEVKWEEIEQVNVGIDASFLDGKINFTTDYYIKNTADMLIGVQLPPSFGVSSTGNPESTQINIGEVENRGLELTLNYRNQFGFWNFDFTGNASWNSNEVKRLTEGQRIFAGGGGPGFSNSVAVTEAGYPIGSFFGWDAVGIFQTQEEINALNAGAQSGVYQSSETRPGDLRYRDVNEDGRITPADRTIIGNPWPRMIYGFNFNVSYKNIDFTLFLQGVQGVELFNATKSYYRTVFSDYNTSDLVFESWTPENRSEYPRLISTDPNGNYRRPSSYHVEDGSYLRVRNIQLGYSFPKSMIERLGIRNARLFLNAQNLMTFTSYEGIDPEIGGGGNTARGIDNLGQYPQTIMYSTGVQIGF